MLSKFQLRQKMILCGVGWVAEIHHGKQAILRSFSKIVLQPTRTEKPRTHDLDVTTAQRRQLLEKEG